MKQVIAVIVVLAVCVVGFGFYRGWFVLSNPSPTGGSNEVNVNLATDTDMMKEDVQMVKDKAAELTGNVTEGDADPPSDEAQPNQESPEDGQRQGVEPNAVRSNGD